MYCESCASIFESSPPVNISRQGKVFTSLSSGILHKTSEDFKASTSIGCQICSALFRALPSKVRDNLSVLDYQQAFATFEFFSPVAAGSKLTLAVHFPGAIISYKNGAIDARLKGRLDRGHVFTLHQIAGYFDRAADYSIVDPSANTGSKRALAQARTWYERCTIHHSGCNSRTNATQYYPARLIEIGCQDVTAFRLCVRGEDPIEGPYATLSYVKNTGAFRGLLTFNMHEWRMRIPHEDLPKVYRDAAEVARALGLRYLFVDSLCILQDSKEDQQKELSNMGEIFTNSCITIAAAACNVDVSGLFVSRNPFCFVRFAFFVRLKTTSGAEQLYFLDDSHYWTSRIDDSPLLSQGWFIQERTLAPRILYFSDDIMLWECNQTTATEEFPQSVPFGRAQNTKPSITNDTIINSISTDTSPDNNHRLVWGRVIRSYTRAQLGNAEDKLVAISGLAKRLHEVIKSSYIAGLWKCSLIGDLAWRTEVLEESTRPSIYRAPSWSWASIDGPIVPGCWLVGQELATLIDYELAPVTQDHFGLLKSGYVRLSGYLYPAKVNVKIQGGTVLQVNVTGEFEPRKNLIFLDVFPQFPEDETEKEFSFDNLPDTVELGIIDIVVHDAMLRTRLPLRFLCPRWCSNLRSWPYTHCYFSTAFEPPKPDIVEVPVGSSGKITLDIYHPPRPSDVSSVILYFPRGPLAINGALPPTNLSSLAVASNLTVVQVNYRLSEQGPKYPTPIHDALAGYDWAVKHFASGSNKTASSSKNAGQNKIGICGELLGGSIAAAIGLTECHIRTAGVRAMILGNPVTDWTSMYPVLPDGQRPLANPPPPPKPRKRATTRAIVLKASWDANATNPLLPTTELLRARTRLFYSAEDYFDPFASPMLFFKTPSIDIPGNEDPLDELFAELDGVVRPVERKRKNARKYPPLDSDLRMPNTRIWVGKECVLRDQGVELGKAIEKVDKDGRVIVEKMNGTGLWTSEMLLEIGEWLGFILRS